MTTPMKDPDSSKVQPQATASSPNQKCRKNGPVRAYLCRSRWTPGRCPRWWATISKKSKRIRDYEEIARAQQSKMFNG